MAGLEINTLDAQRAAQHGPFGVADRRLWLAADERTVVEEGDARAAFLLVGRGHAIPRETATKLNLSMVDGRVVQDAPTPESVIASGHVRLESDTDAASTGDGEKQQEKPEDKSLPLKEDKAAPPPADKGGKKKKGFFGKG